MNWIKQTGRALLLAVALLCAPCRCWASINVTMLVDDDEVKSASLRLAEQNLGAILSEINRAQKAHENLSTRSLPMDEFAMKSLVRIWAVTPFYCDDEEIVERVWVFSNGTMMMSHIPLIITPDGESFGVGSYQEAVVEFDSKGIITDFRLAINAQMYESLEHCGSTVEREKQMVILQQIERFRTAYNQKDIVAIERMFSDDALIITGNVVMVKQNNDNNSYSSKVSYTRLNKEQYISNLRRAFARNKWIEVKFTDIAEKGEGGCSGITRSKVNPNMYGVRLFQEWRSSNYNDDGYLFLLWEFPEDGSDPIIHVRTWQPDKVGGETVAPDDAISTLSGFDL